MRMMKVIFGLGNDTIKRKIFYSQLKDRKE
mgnify:CR=1 FL=1